MNISVGIFMDIPLFHPIILVIFMLSKKIDPIGILICHYYNNLIIAFEENWGDDPLGTFDPLFFFHLSSHICHPIMN